jgi:RNA 2',3'-cyclic 3'-phosphodiesterase
VNLPASVEGREHARLFCGLRFPDDVVDALSAWQARQIRGGRLVPREHLHVTLAFLGHRPLRELTQIVDALRRAAQAARPIRLMSKGYRETRSVGMLTLTDEGGSAALLADDLQGRLERLGVYRRERRPWLPHVTVVRFREPLRLRPPVPDLGEIVPSDAAAFISQLRPTGARYVVLESFALGGAL